MEKKKLSPPNSPPKIEIALSFKSTWDYNSLGVQIGLTDEVRSEENVDQALERIYSWVESRMMTKIEETKEEVDRVYVKKRSTRKQ